MFTHQHSLRHLLRPEHYFSESHYQLELEKLFRPSWQFVAAKSELPEDGDFLTLDLFGHPILIRNSRGRFLAYENICSHRHCMLTNAATGNQPDLRCQYHGWEFNDRGSTAMIPEARCFRPWDRDHARLNMFRLEACGDLLFVSLDAKAASLREWMEPFYDEVARAYSSPMWSMRHIWEYDCNSNWKIPAENTLESYHLPALHPKTFGDSLPPEEQTEHLLHERYTTLVYEVDSRMELAQAALNRWLGGVPTVQHRHRHIHPNTILVSSDTFSYALMYVPTSPTTVRIRVRMFGLRGTRRGPLASLVSSVVWRIGKSRTLRIQQEDMGIYVSQQNGLERSRHPGVLGSREERIYFFQRYVLTALGLPLPVDPAEATAGQFVNLQGVTGGSAGTPDR